MARTPTDPTKAQVWVTGEGPEYGFEFYFPRGAKGEPGGLTSTIVPGYTDLDQYVTPGAYSVTNGIDKAADALAHLPMNEAGTLLVTLSGAGTVIIQTYVTNTKSIYVRRRFGSTWSGWRHFGSSRVDQTAGRAMYQWDEVNQREQLTYGDTGLRQVKTDLLLAANGWDPAPSNVFLRRVGQLVELKFDVYTSPAGTVPSSSAWLTIPAGYRVPSAGSHTDFVCYSEPNGGTTPTIVMGRVTATWADFLFGGRAASNIRFIRGGATWITNEPWPTTLPGTAVGSIPNL